ncbi:PR domain zinc finger protein 4-like isoform X2 [Paramacrobiotus metropolitanus]|uniref:PR domain zinc finger protein 4-like isoform X2 n=1 Tax=Paramacrobiotus metropolitanus TaxID=2943436 RepID=UPI002445CA78|nr:PR domain zinc finger protein 4-like isoform X2 [Paramacrobiotus metropolitanus]
MDDIQERLLSHRYYNTKVEYASVVVDYLIHTLGRDSETLRKLASVLDLGGAHMTECLPFDPQPIIISGKKHPPHVAVVRTFRWWQASKLFSWVTCTVGPESVCINPFHYKKRTRFQDMQNGDGEIVDSSAIFLCNGSIASQPIPMDASSQSVQGDPVFHSSDSHISLPTAKQQGLKCWMPGCDVDLKESVVDEENPRHYFRFPQEIVHCSSSGLPSAATRPLSPWKGPVSVICTLVHLISFGAHALAPDPARPRCTLSEGAVPVPQVFSWMYDSEALPEASQPSVRLSVRNVAVRQMSKTDDSMHVDLCSSKEDCNVAIKKEPFSCSVCQDVGDEPCWTHMRHVQDTHVLPLSLTSLPNILEFDKENAGVVTKSMILPQTMFGPFVAPLSHKQSQFVGGNEENFLQLDSDHQCNWMKHIRFAIKPEDQNLSVCLRESDVYFIATKLIPPGMELKAGYSEKYSWTLQNARKRRKLCDIALHCDLVDNTQDVCETFCSENDQNLGKTLNSCTPEVEDNGLSVLSTVDRPDSVPTISSRIYCPKPFKQPTLTNTFKYRCPECELNFRSEALLNLHVLDHQDYVQEHVSMQCVGCEYVGQNFADLIQHVGQHGLTSNEMVRRYKMRTCPVCGGNAVHPREHIQMSHPDVFRDMASTWTLQCQTCKEKFPTEKGLHLHEKSVHQKRTNRDCRICQKVFASWMELRDHVQCHRGAEGFTCDECGKTFDAYAKLIRHLQQKHCPEVTGKFIGKDASFLKLVQEFLEQQTEKGILYNRSKQPSAEIQMWSVCGCISRS